METDLTATTDNQTTHLGARLFDGVTAIVVTAMSSFWLDGALATEPAI